MSGALWRHFELALARTGVEAAYAVVSDVERYPEFLPGFSSARILRREPKVWRVENRCGFGPFASRFSSLAYPEPPYRLTIVSRDGPWRELVVDWRLREAGEGCRVTCEARLDFRSRALAALARLAAAEVERQVRTAFERRIGEGASR